MITLGKFYVAIKLLTSVSEAFYWIAVIFKVIFIKKSIANFFLLLLFLIFIEILHQQFHAIFIAGNWVETSKKPTFFNIDSLL